ncbi:MAG TPA: hypothetical protein VJL56_06695, partial [Candidatus Bathyarchaeia archaeon]|nr:hypothetical protein [Candidatus Bathyarchaeia archaeon]
MKKAGLFQALYDARVIEAISSSQERSVSGLGLSGTVSFDLSKCIHRMVRITRQRITLLLLLAALILTIQASLPEKAHAQPNVYVASLYQNIDPGAEDFVISSINDASSSGIHKFILILNTNGGSGSNMENIISAISNYEGVSNNNFTTLVAPSSAHAFSAGAYIAESSSSIFMVPGTVIGSATPIVSGIPTGEENTTLAKDINAFTQYMT